MIGRLGVRLYTRLDRMGFILLPKPMIPRSASFIYGIEGFPVCVQYKITSERNVLGYVMNTHNVLNKSYLYKCFAEERVSFILRLVHFVFSRRREWSHLLSC